MRAAKLLSSVVIWTAFILGPALALMLQSEMNKDDTWIVLLLFFASVFQTGILWFLVRRAEDVLGAVKRGASVGFLVPTVGGFLLATGMGNYEARAVGLVLGIPSALGGALAGWIQWSARKPYNGTDS